MVRKIRLFTVFFFLGFCILNLYARNNENLHSYKLENGLELYVLENHSVPLAFFQIAVKCGSTNQEAAQEGIFYIYQQMTLKGNNKYRSSIDFSKAMSAIGTSDFKTAVNHEMSSYSFTVPSEKAAQGIELWSAALRNPKLDKRELENQKKITTASLNTLNQQKSQTPENFIYSKLFPDIPWKLDCYGTKESIESITVKQLKEIQKNYYVPDNTAIFISGDVNPEEISKITSKHFGSWKKSKTNWAERYTQLNQNPLSSTSYYVIPSENISDQTATVIAAFRGPDAGFNQDETISQNLLFSILENPEGKFKKNYLCNQSLGITDSGNLSVTSELSRFTSVIKLQADFLVPEQYMPERTQLFFEEFSSNIQSLFHQQSAQLESEIKKAKKRENYKLLFQTQSPEDFISVLKDFWVSADEEYFNSYLSSIQNTRQDSLEDFYKSYILNKNALILVLINSGVYNSTKNRFLEEGFIELTESKIQN